MNWTADLFSELPDRTCIDRAPLRIPMMDAEVQFVQRFYSQPLSGEYMECLVRDIQWREERIRLWGKEYLQPRLSAWYGDPGQRYTYSGIILDPQPWTATLRRIKEDIEAICGHRFNSVLLNLYRDQDDSVGWHSDDERELGDMPVIASLSLGETRTFRMRHKIRKDLPPVAMDLNDGSLLLMAGTTQKCWRHAVHKQRVQCGPRINLTFRHILAG